MSLSAPFIQRPIAHHAADGRRRAGRASSAYRLLPVSPLPQVDFPTISVSGVAARRQPGDHGVVRGDAARAAIRPHRRRDRDDLVEHARPDQHHAAVRS